MKRDSTFALCGAIVLSILTTTLFSASNYVNDNRNLFQLPYTTGVGNARMVFSNDATVVSNPAHLAWTTQKSMNCSYTGYYNNALSTSLISLVTPIQENVGAGMSIGYLHIPVETSQNMVVDSVTKQIVFIPKNSVVSEILMNFCIGRLLFQNESFAVSVGGSVHIQRRSLLVYKGYGIGADLGISTDLIAPHVRISALIDDATTNYIRWSKNYQEFGYPRCRIGIGWIRDVAYLYGTMKIMYKSPDLFSHDGLIFNQMSNEEDKLITPSNDKIQDNPLLLLSAAAFGIEYSIYNAVHLRFGLDEFKRMNFGCGINFFMSKFVVDFAYVSSYLLPSTYSLSFGYAWL